MQGSLNASCYGNKYNTIQQQTRKFSDESKNMITVMNYYSSD